MKERRFHLIAANFIIVAVLGIVTATAFFALSPGDTDVVNTDAAIYEGDAGGDAVSLMVNVYEGTEYVERIAALLKERGFRTTFFVGGKWVERNGDTLMRLAADGFEIGNHGYLHRDHATLGLKQNEDEIKLTESLISAYTSQISADGEYPFRKLFAPPSGSLGKNMFEACEKLGYEVIMWTRDTIDWRDHDADVIYGRAVKDLKAGDLILMHPTECTVAALPRILDRITEAGLRVAPVGECLKAAD